MSSEIKRGATIPLLKIVMIPKMARGTEQYDVNPHQRG